MTIGFETRRCGGGLIPMPNTHATARRIGQARLEHGQQLRKLGAAQAFRATGCLDEGAPLGDDGHVQGEVDRGRARHLQRLLVEWIAVDDPGSAVAQGGRFSRRDELRTRASWARPHHDRRCW